MTRDVCNQNTHMLFIDDQKIVEIASHRVHRNIASGYLDARYLFHFLGQNERLNLARRFKLMFYGEQVFFILKKSMGDYIDKTTNKNQEAQTLEICTQIAARKQRCDICV